MKKNLAKLVGALSLSALALSGCSSDGEPEAQPAEETDSARGANSECSAGSCSADGEKKGENNCGGGSCGGGASDCGGGN